MTLPVEDYIAAFPPSEKAGNVTLGPMTLRHAVLFGAFGVPLDTKIKVPLDKLVVAALILSRDWVAPPSDGDFKRFAKKVKCSSEALGKAVETCRAQGQCTYVSPREQSGGTKRSDAHGLGWPLEVAEFLCGEYGWSWRDALATPTATAFALVAACRQRNGGKHGDFDYVERVRSDDAHRRKLAKAKGA